MLQNPRLWYRNLPEGLQTYLLIWFGGFVSLTGTGMTTFALVTWAYGQTGTATSVALLLFWARGAQVIVSPFAGVIIDRYDRRLVMFVSDLGAAILTLVTISLFISDNLVIWHLYALQALTGVLDAFTRPAYSVVISVLVPRRHLPRANALRSLAVESSGVISPFIAGLVLVTLGMGAVFIIDIITFMIAAYILWIVRLPKSLPISTENDDTPNETFLQQVAYGFRYIFKRSGLKHLMFIFAGINFTATLTYLGVLPAMILARSGGDELALATVQSAMGLGGFISAGIISAIGGPRRLIHGALGFTAVSFIFGDFLLGTGQSTLQWAFGGFVAAILIPPIVTSERAIWQSKVPNAVQGRVFAVQSVFREGLNPVGFLLGGLLADFVFEPAFQPDGALVETLGWLVGTGDGAGMGFMFVCTAFIGLTISLCGYLMPSVRNIEDDLPDMNMVD